MSVESVALPNGRQTALNRLLFVEHSVLLRAYLDVVVTTAPFAESCSFARLLVEYFTAHGIVCNLVREVAEHCYEVSSQPTANMAMLRVFAEYAAMSLKEYAKAALQGVMRSIVFEAAPQQDRLITEFCDGVLAALPTLPHHFVRSMQVLRDAARGSDSPVTQFFFCRFLCPLLECPQHILEGVPRDTLTSRGRHIAHFASFVSDVISKGKGDSELIALVKQTDRFFARPVATSTDHSGIDLDEQRRLHGLIVLALRDHEEQVIEYITETEDNKPHDTEEASKTVAAFRSAIGATEVKMNEIEALKEASRLLYGYSDMCNSRVRDITQENNDCCAYLLEVGERIRVIRQQIEEERATQRRLQDEIRAIERGETPATRP